MCIRATSTSWKVGCLILESTAVMLAWHDTIDALTKWHHIRSWKRPWLQQVDTHESISELFKIELWKVIDAVIHEHRQVPIFKGSGVWHQLIVRYPISSGRFHGKECSVDCIVYTIHKGGSHVSPLETIQHLQHGWHIFNLKLPNDGKEDGRVI